MTIEINGRKKYHVDIDKDFFYNTKAHIVTLWLFNILQTLFIIIYNLNK